MKGQTVMLLGAAALAIIVLSSANSNNSNIDLSGLNSQYGADNVARLQSVLNALSNAGLNDLEIKMCLAQILQETGLFTDNPNYHATDTLNNYAGISSGGNLKGYSNVNQFVTDYLRVLNLPNAYPIDAVSISDFNDRLKANGYYTDSKTTYGNNLNAYFNLLG